MYVVKTRKAYILAGEISVCSGTTYWQTIYCASLKFKQVISVTVYICIVNPDTSHKPMRREPKVEGKKASRKMLNGGEGDSQESVYARCPSLFSAAKM